MAKNIQNHYPNVRRATPLFEKKVMDTVYGKLYPQGYDAEKGIITFPSKSCHLRAGVADIDPALIERNPRIGFFVSMNPDWQRGAELACISKMDAQALFYYPIKSIFKLSALRLARSLKRLGTTETEAETKVAVRTP
ncbi:hypothetical protein K2X33_10620 [bacterium]|nr:hypothetical protein [bacterium]